MAKVREFLELCGYTEDEEIKRTIPRLEESMRRAKMELDEVDYAIESMRKNYRSDLELMSVRKMLGVCLKKWMALMLCRDEHKKGVYHFHLGEPRQALLLNTISDDIFCDFADTAFWLATGYVFNNLSRYLEMGEKHGLPPARAHCGASLLALAVQAEGLIPRPDLVVGSDTQCDQQHKVAELVAQLWDVPMVKLDTVADEAWGLFPEISDRAVKYWGATMEAELLRKTEEILGIEITDEALNQSRHQYANYWRVMDELAHLLAEADPRPVSVAPSFLYTFWALLADRIVINEGIPAMQLHLEELKERIARGFGVVPKGAPKIALKCGLGADMNALYLAEDVGLNVAVSANASWLAEFEKFPKIDYARFKTASPMEKIAAAYLRKGYVRAIDHHVWRLKEMMKELKAKGLVDGLLFTPVYQCRAFAGLPMTVKQTVEKEVGIPVMYLETGAMDGRDHTYETMKTKVETFAELLKARKATEEAKK